MQHEERQPDQNAMPEAQRSEAVLQPSPTSVTPPTPIDPILATIRKRFGLGNNYLPDDISVQGLLSALEHADWRVRTAAARRLGSSGEGNEVKTALLSALHDSAPAVRAATARSLGDLDDVPEEPLLYLLRNDTDDDVRTAAAQALSTLGERLSQYTAAGLENAFRRTRENSVTRAAIIYTLGGRGKSTSLDLLREAMQDRDWLVREAAVIMMGEQEDRADEKALQDLANKEDEYPPVAQAVYQALGNLSIYHDNQLAQSEPLIQIVVNRDPAQKPPVSLIEPAYKIPQQVANVEFDGIEPGFINIEQRIPVVAQALDNQWVPRTLLKALLSGRVTMESAQNYLTGLVRTEYLRSLINGEQMIVNRAFLYNNSVIARDYMQAGPDREVFKQFLAEGTIIPFLLYEKSPDESPKFTTVPQNLTAWQQICQEIRMQCMRFSWQDEDRNKYDIQRLGSGLHSFAQSDQVLSTSHLLRDFGLPEDREPALRKLLSDMHTWSREFYDETGKHINREDIYRRYITNGDPALRSYDGSKLFAGEIKQFFDVVYNNNLAEALNGYLLTPVDSPTSLILQDLHAHGEGNKYYTTQQLVQLLREKVFQIVQGGLYLRSIRMLRLQDIQVIRSTDEWHAYIESLQQLLRAPLAFADLANDVYQHYIKLAQVITRLIETRDALMGGVLRAEWRPDARLIINVGGSETTITWKSGEDKPFTDAAEQKKTLPKAIGGIAPVNVRLVIGDSSSPAKLHTSIDIIQGRMQAAQMQWRDLCDQFVKQLYFREFSLAQTQSENLPNLNATAGSTV